MSSSAGQNDVDRVRDAVDLVRLIGDHIALKPRGREYIGMCPFHDDHRPSMTVVSHKGHAFYKCFACGASGDCFRFVMDFHKMEFGDALRFLADRVGITLQRRGGGPAGGSGASGRDDVREVLARGEAFFRRCLGDATTGEAARQVIEQRGIARECVERFGLGAALHSFDGFLRHLRGGGDASGRVRAAVTAGLVRERDGRVFDTMRNRLIFPIHDEMGRPIAFGGRVLDPEDKPKYLNTPESPVFQKSRTLYGLGVARRPIIEAGVAIITEGYTDVIACHQAGITNVVGTLGTALTAQHATVLSRLCNTVVLVFDGDEAGQRAADRGLAVFFTQPVDVRICVLPDGLDPDGLISQDGGAARFRDAVDQSVDALEYKLRRFQSGLDQTQGLSARQRHLESFLRELADLGFGSLQGVRKRLVMTRLADLLGVSIADVEAALPRGARGGARGGPRTPAETPTDGTTGKPIGASPAPLAFEPGDAASRARRIAEHDFLAILLVEPEEAIGTDLDRHDADPGGADPIAEWFTAADFVDTEARAVASVFLPLLIDGRSPTLQQLLDELPEGPVRALATDLFLAGSRRFGSHNQRDSRPDEAAHALLLSAAEGLRECIEREKYQTQAARVSAAIPPAGADDPGAVEALVQHIRKRGEHGDLPAAIPRGVRS